MPVPIKNLTFSNFTTRQMTETSVTNEEALLLSVLKSALETRASKAHRVSFPERKSKPISVPVGNTANPGPSCENECVTPTKKQITVYQNRICSMLDAKVEAAL